MVDYSITSLIFFLFKILLISPVKYSGSWNTNLFSNLNTVNPNVSRYLSLISSLYTLWHSPWEFPSSIYQFLKAKANHRGGLPAAIPFGRSCNSKLLPTRFTRLVFLFLSLSQTTFGKLQKIKIPQLAAGVIWSCGERGIRTPGPPIGGQRFSRPPHSTTLPSLQYIKPHSPWSLPRQSGPSLQNRSKITII